MKQFIGCDAHKKFSVFGAVNEEGHDGEAVRVAHDRQLYREFLTRLIYEGRESLTFNDNPGNFGPQSEGPDS